MLPKAMRMAPTAGPMMNARLSRLDHAALAGPSSVSSRTRVGISEPMAGEKNAEKHAASRLRMTMRMIGPLIRVRAVRPSMIAPRATSVTIRIRRRSNRSAAMPAGTESRM